MVLAAVEIMVSDIRFKSFRRLPFEEGGDPALFLDIIIILSYLTTQVISLLIDILIEAIHHLLRKDIFQWVQMIHKNVFKTDLALVSVKL